ncbi:hypothetical protein EBN03_12075 [Nocardia stercoris]|uniref:Uncharacterized protein n=1 Tax=Nocardia stercoris TaxID=2483361 RepID=A0A3M2L4X5_9NOCA|nr:hypothetical protein EBN03_12075 [Nocardia stercoris]
MIEDPEEAIDIAHDESMNGRRVRIHRALPHFVHFMEDDDGHQIETDPDFYWIVDVFDEPIPQRFTETGKIREL